MTFTVVTPNFNMARFLPETIESVLTNLRPGDEYIVIDGGSTDGSVEVIRRYESQLTGWISEPDSGYADAVSKGFRRSTGTFLCWINSGDLLLRGALDTARERLASLDADLIFGDDLHMDEAGRVLQHTHGGIGSLRDVMLFGGWTPLQDACYWRRSLYERVGGIDPFLHYAADYDFFLRAAWAGRCVYVPEIFSAFRKHAGQKSISGVAAYKAERLECGRRMARELGISPARQVLAGSYHSFLVRWRHHVARRFHREAVPFGTPVATLVGL